MALDPMRFVYYSIQAENLPNEFQLPSDVNELLNMKIQSNTFENERKLVEKYARINREVSYDKTEKPLKDFLKVTNTYIEEEPEIIPLPALKASNSVAEEFDHKNSLIQQMIAQTGQEGEVCSFYLESVNWDYNLAIDMFKSMS